MNEQLTFLLVAISIYSWCCTGVQVTVILTLGVMAVKLVQQVLGTGLCSISALSEIKPTINPDKFKNAGK